MNRLFMLIFTLSVVFTLTSCADLDPEIIDDIKQYKPGVYFNHTDVGTNGYYTYTVVIIDAYGQIAGVLFDETKTTSEFFIDDDDQLYVCIEGDGEGLPHTYRAISRDIPISEYPKASDAVTADDLVSDINEAEILALNEIIAHETRKILGDVWVGQTELLAERIVADQTTYGIDTSEYSNDGTDLNDEYLTSPKSDLLLGLVQVILDGEAQIDDDTVLATTPVHGLYTPGYEFGVTGRLVGTYISYYTSFIAVDTYGNIAGVYVDVTAPAEVEDSHGTAWIHYGINLEAQARAFGEAVVEKQGTPFTYYETNRFRVETPLPAQIPGGFDYPARSRIYTDEIAGCTIGVEGLATAVEAALSGLTN